MTPNHPPWLVRWQQADDDELLYVDQTLLVQMGTPLEEVIRVFRPCDEEEDDEA